MKNAKRLNFPIDRRTLLKGSILGGAAAIVNRFLLKRSETSLLRRKSGRCVAIGHRDDLRQSPRHEGERRQRLQGRSLRRINRREESLHAAR